MLTVLVPACAERAQPHLSGRRPWRCYTLQFAAWQPAIPQERIAFLPRGVELDAVLIAPTKPQLGLRINALAGNRIDIAANWRPLVPDTIEMRFSAAGHESERHDVVVRARTDERTISGVATASDGSRAALSGARVACQ